MKRDAEGSLDRYNAMRDFEVTEEPAGRLGRTRTRRTFVIQKHHARRLHYDVRLEEGGVLLSWAVPKGPSLDPRDKRLAVQTEDHPVDYRDFEGTIPAGQYGGGAVIVWDRGTWEPIGDPRASLEEGRLDFVLHGEKIRGRFVLVRTRRRDTDKKPTWLLIKRTDDHVAPKRDIAKERPESVLTGRTIADVERGVSARGSRCVAPLPPLGSIAPQLATLVSAVPDRGDWVYEIKYDGYRTLAWLEDGEVTLASRRGLDWTSKYPLVAEALSRVRAKRAIFDGEIAYVEGDGRTSFQRLQETLGGKASRDRAARAQARLVYFVFDLLHCDGVDLTSEALHVRKDKLRTILAGVEPPLKMSDDVRDGDAFFREACKLGLEGVIGKRRDAPYRSGRGKDWIKVKCQKRQELVVVGFTPPKGGAKGIGSLLLGVREDARSALRYAGKVGTGFSNQTRTDLARRLSSMVVDEPPIANPPRVRTATWVEPKLVAEVRFSEWTKDGALRHPAFQGLREDKAAREVVKETEAPAPRSGHAARRRALDDAKPRVDGLVISHPERVIDASTGLTKLDLARYAGAVAEVQLPYVAKRPLMMLRCPSGTEDGVFRQSDRRRGKKTSCFVQKHSGQGLDGASLARRVIAGEETLHVTNARQLVRLAQHNVVELHGWGSTFPKWDRPDTIVLDLDPDEALPFETVIDAAFELRGALRTLGLESWVKTTGGKGLHVVVPIARRYDWATVKRASRRIAELMAEAAPSRYVATMSKKRRAGRIFLDYLRNAEGATAVLPYSARARPGLPVAVPVSWRELRRVDPRDFTIATVPAILAKRKVDPWADLLAARQTLPTELVEASREA